MTSLLTTPASYNRSLWRFFTVQALYNLMFFMPTWVIFLQERHGLSLTQVTLIDLAFWLTMAFTEVPTGAAADTIGRKQSMLIGIGLSAISVTAFGLAPNFLVLMIANSLWGIAITFISGADIAFFYDTLRAQGREGDYARLRGWLSATAIAGGGLANIIGGYLGGRLGSQNLGNLFWLYGLVLCLAFLVGLSLKEPPRPTHADTGQPIKYSQVLKLTWSAIIKQPYLRFSLLFSNILPLASMLVTTIFIQPHLRAINVPLAWMGVVLFGFSLLRILASTASGWVARLGRRWLWLSPWLVLAGTAALALIPNLAGVALFGLAIFVSVASRPLIESLILQDSPEATRATILSMDNLIFRLLLTVVEPAGGATADIFGLPVMFIGLAVGVWLAMMVILPLWRPMRPGASAQHLQT
jgi:predicted MFS family arabinose efflux permease